MSPLVAPISPAAAWWLCRLGVPAFVAQRLRADGVAPPEVVAALKAMQAAAALHDDALRQVVAELPTEPVRGLSTDAVAGMLGVEPRTVRRMIADQRLVGWREGNRWVVDPTSVAA